MKKLTILFLTFYCALAFAGAGDKAPDRKVGQGPYERLILRGGIVVNGEGAPARGPMDIVIENDRIVSMVSVGNPGVPIKESGRPKARKGDIELDVSGQYILPGFIDMHGHIGGSADDIPAEYVFKLWLAHGITTVREPGSFNGVDWVMDHVKRSQKNEIAAPRIIPYVGFGMESKQAITTPEQAKKWVKYIAKRGAKGIKFFGAPPAIMEAALTEAKQQSLGSMMHHAQLEVTNMNVIDSARLGLTTMEHWYGLPEALFEHQRIQDYSPEYNYNDEQNRFGEAGRLWQQAAKPGSKKWQQVRDELIALDFTINPTMTIYEASRDLMREMNADWHNEYTLPTLWQFFQPNKYAHGSYWFDWTTDDEIAWKKNYQQWMTFINDYKNNGGRVTTGSDAGYIFKIYGFGFVRELELLREAGFNALEVIQSATINGAQALGLEQDIGSLRVGKKADMVIVAENPLRNFKVLYGTGHFQLGENNKPVRKGGVNFTIKDGIIYDAKALLSEVRAMVEKAKQKQG
ncbi:amidohydrolase family protein [Thalassotalea sp. 1_MG-2023]|uniref:amidohydrolase family protein n=1 Tax=Thalassotalea sp. 1_MG-2023 TaxID=3062680 RepID=UPI0026E36D46|nr:amidohydrolase family protein [Thalassotalea sp. 1_MG-2023]MDO6428159.1 amidohydrolase family protein [Thalassotalea sp. 1_MG-2023]